MPRTETHPPDVTPSGRSQTQKARFNLRAEQGQEKLVQVDSKARITFPSWLKDTLWDAGHVLYPELGGEWEPGCTGV